jgi:hypothetical protein
VGDDDDVRVDRLLDVLEVVYGSGLAS